MRKKQLPLLILLLGYTLGVFRGNIALWNGSDPIPIRTFPYSIDSLPPADRQALSQGIRVEDYDCLLRLLEDYLS